MVKTIAKTKKVRVTISSLQDLLKSKDNEINDLHIKLCKREVEHNQSRMDMRNAFKTLSHENNILRSQRRDGLMNCRKAEMHIVELRRENRGIRSSASFRLRLLILLLIALGVFIFLASR